MMLCDGSLLKRVGNQNGFDILDMGITKYDDALKIQLDILNDRICGKASDTIIFTEHYPSLVLGRTSAESSIRSLEYFKNKKVPVIKTTRGGDITYHSPGQLVIYPVIDLSVRGKNISLYLDLLEKAAVNVLSGFGIPAERTEGKRGVWVKKKKVAFSGISLKKWITSHGMIVNINNDVVPFSYIDPCGQKDITVTSAKEFLGRDLDMNRVKKAFIKELTNVFAVRDQRGKS